MVCFAIRHGSWATAFIHSKVLACPKHSTCEVYVVYGTRCMLCARRGANSRHHLFVQLQ